MSAVERLVDELVAAPNGPAGMTVAIRHGGVDRVVVGGSRDGSADSAAAMTATTSHDLASVTKVFTTAALVRLVGAGALRLDDRVASYVAAFDSPDKRHVTIAHLLEHRAGLWEWWPLYLAAPSATEPGGDPAAVAAALPLRYPPGQGRHYSDLGFVVLGSVVATVTGTPFDRAVDELVLAPLGLDSARFGAPVDAEVATGSRGDDVERRMLDTGTPYPVPFRSDSFTGWRTGPIAGAVSDGNAFHALGGVAAHAGLFSTAADLLALGSALGGTGDEFDSATLAAFGAAGADPAQALGFRRYEFAAVPGGVLLGHPGFVGCGIGWDPDGDLVVALLSNRLLATAGDIPTSAELLAATLDAVASDLGGGS